MKKTRRSVIMKAAAILLAGTMVSSSMSGLIAFAEEEESGYATVTNTLEVDPVYVGETITIEEEPVVEFEGTITDDNPVYEYTYTAETSGSYYFDIEDVKENCSVYFAIYDSFENQICKRANEVVSLEEAETYTLQVSQYSGNTPFTLQIKSQKPTTDISEVTSICDQVMFEGETNRYKYTAPITGRYHFFISDTTANVSYRLIITNQYGLEIANTKNGSAAVELEENISYDIEVDYSSGIGLYTMSIHPQKPIIDVSGYTEIQDSIEYGDQRNSYTFVAPEEGYYCFEMKDFEAIESNYGGNVYNENEEEVAVFGYSYSSSSSAYLTKGEEYTIRFNIAWTAFDYGLGDYTLKISYPSAAQEYLENFAAGNVSTASTTSADESETEGTSEETASTDSSQTDILQQQIDELQSELEDMQEENDRLKEILEENEIVYD